MKGIKITWAGVLVALTVIGAAIKIPAIIGSVALDAFPALLGAAILGGPAGAIVGGMGHLLSALMGGMPLGPFHLLVAAEMAILAFIFAVFYRRGRKWTASLLFVLGNSFAAPLPFLLLMGEAFYLAIVPSLFIGSILNTVVAILIIPRLAKAVEPLLTNVRSVK
ncbi:ECF transporter S component [Cytobacillus purgationiresistens]|uniref:Membrane protein n=1 Tax=Cytobacillus purgationiresistens TaxID=863449 RepID=A0ABU0AR26_9BACI|nr:ECF transporter S component [Cytobacillus purgationiresistens]MDQ0273232.1 putative membrane protein [Cytobacillus purgationiresistens]